MSAQRRTLLPKARFFGIITSSDSDAVNWLALKNARKEVPGYIPLLPNLCFKHMTETTMDHVTDLTGVRGGLYCSTKVTASGQTWKSITDAVEADVDKMDVVDPNTFFACARRPRQQLRAGFFWSVVT